MTERIPVGQWAMELAYTCSRRSTCLRRAVGCVLLDEANHVLSTGYNGVHAGAPHCNQPNVVGSGRVFFGKRNAEVANVTTGDARITYPNACAGADSPSGTNLDACEAIHAEQNALLQCRDVREVRTAFVTTAPCVTCTKLLLNTGCREIIWLNDYPQAEAARALWEGAGRFWGPYLGSDFRVGDERSDA